MKNFYIILILFFSFTIYSCAKKSDTSSTTATNTEIEGTWQTPCHSQSSNWPGSSGYYKLNKLTVSGTNWTDTTESHSDSSCTTDWSTWTSTYGSLSIGNELTFPSYGSSGGSGHDFTLTLSEYTYTSNNSANVSSNNDNSFCGLTGWEINTAQSVAGKTCGLGWTISAIGTAYYGIYILDGSKLFWTLSSDAYNDSVPTGDNDTFTKQ